jgi:hypothetical protein
MGTFLLVWAVLASAARRNYIIILHRAGPLLVSKTVDIFSIDGVVKLNGLINMEIHWALLQDISRVCFHLPMLHKSLLQGTPSMIMGIFPPSIQAFHSMGTMDDFRG